jgi:hypothetical protein
MEEFLSAGRRPTVMKIESFQDFKLPPQNVIDPIVLSLTAMPFRLFTANQIIVFDFGKLDTHQVAVGSIATHKGLLKGQLDYFICRGMEYLLIPDSA